MSDYEISILNRNVLIKVVKEQQEIINKAIKLLEKYGNGTFDENLLKILKGENNDKN